MPSPALGKGLTITNPLVLYRALVATQRIQPDEAQHRLAIHLQKLYHRLKDYEPQKDYRAQLTEIGATFEQPPDAAEATPTKPGILARWRAQKVDAEAMALTRRLTSHESALHIDSPKGLLLYGEVGTGKSMLVDLLADSLPTGKKRRYHFNTFMLETFARLDRLRRERLLMKNNASLVVEDAQSSALLLLARDLIATSPILFLDEFQLPDRAASKILSNLFTSFFHLGGVLVATSNRMPEELSKASGMDFSAASSRSSFSRVQEALFGSSSRGRSEGMFNRQSDFVAFLEVLRARCETWDMNSAQDWRRIEMKGTTAESAPKKDAAQGTLEVMEELSPGNLGLGFEQSKDVVAEDALEEKHESTEIPAHYHTAAFPGSEKEDDSTKANIAIRAAVGTASIGTAVPEPIPWMSARLKVYGRNVSIPRVFNGVTLWTFSELCATNLGPADYLTMASNYHTFIVSDVPILSLLQKNEARRFITLLDALYEARCKLLIIRAAAGPDGLFFPSSPLVTSNDKTQSQDPSLAEDGTYAETFSEIYQDQTNPFRANISSYNPSASPPSYASSPLPMPQSDPVHGQANRSIRSILADEDSDFGPTYGAGRSSGASAGSSTHSPIEDPTSAVPDFQRSAIFTGDDERFAYRRAESRLWEMCSARWWARQDEGWWRPLREEVRHWERPAETVAGDSIDMHTAVAGDEAQEGKETREEASGAGITHSPFRTASDPPPKISWTHVWGMMTWGKKAGAWGRGVEGLQERSTEKREENDSPAGGKLKKREQEQ